MVGIFELYIKSPIWWCGIFMIVYGEVGNLTALILAPSTLVAPLGLTTWIANAIILSIILKGTIKYQDMLGITLLMVAAFLLVNIPTKSDHILDANKIKECGLWFFIFYLILINATRMMFDHVDKKYKSVKIVVILMQTAILGSFIVVYAKAVSSMLILTLKGENQLKYLTFYFVFAVMGISALSLVRKLNTVMEIDDNNPSYSTSHVVRINFVLFTAAAIVFRFYGSIPLIRFLFLFGALMSIYLVAGHGNKSDTPSPSPSKARQELLNANFNSLKDEAICCRYINDACIEGSSCKHLHLDPRLPFLWQYRKNETWIDFSASISTEIEKFFCDPSNGDNFRKVVTVDFSGNVAPWKGSYRNNQVDIRRLSTVSSVHAKDESMVGLTQWKWYWKSDKDWIEYSEAIKSDDIEKSFLDSECIDFKFQTKEFGYLLKFETMKQHNMGPKYFTKRNVKRRPRLQTLDTIRFSKSKDHQLPTHWPEHCKDGIRIHLVDGDVKKNLTENVLKSFKVTIVGIEEICNDTHYKKFMNSKSEFIKRLGESNTKEMFLYHGTSAESVEGICKQNFDWRLNGMQGVAYGKGTYFARDASYSNNYAKPDVNGHRFMFVAQVLVGNYTNGHSSMSRPPEDTSSGSHRLYDSCVDNVTNPSIYVIFERDQAYPRYLIKYR